ncbi:MAG: hypothetical protein JSW26_11395, partial [Desulfobacterales bacterium]
VYSISGILELPGVQSAAQLSLIVSPLNTRIIPSFIFQSLVHMPQWRLGGLHMRLSTVHQKLQSKNNAPLQPVPKRRSLKNDRPHFLASVLLGQWFRHHWTIEFQKALHFYCRPCLLTVGVGYERGYCLINVNAFPICIIVCYSNINVIN